MASLALGTVQLGMGYGAANTTGMPTDAQATEIVHFAAKNGIRTLDTAHSYDLSQTRLGNALAALPKTGRPSVVTKIDGTIEQSSSDAETIVRVDASVAGSLEKLKIKQLDVLCLHQWRKHGPSSPLGAACWDRALHHRANGNVARVGTSTYSPDEVIEALANPDVSHIQLPFNILDWRWREAGIAEAIAKRPDVTVHARSVFLQGILVSGSERWPAKFGAETARLYIDALEKLVVDLKRKNRVDLCMAYARAQPWITEVLIGAERIEQLAELVELAALPALTPEEMTLVNKALPKAPDDLLMPGNWHDKPSFAGSFNVGLLKDTK